MDVRGDIDQLSWLERVSQCVINGVNPQSGKLPQRSYYSRFPSACESPKGNGEWNSLPLLGRVPECKCKIYGRHSASPVWNRAHYYANIWLFWSMFCIWFVSTEQIKIFDLMWQGITEVITIHPKCNMSDCKKGHAADSCRAVFTSE